MGDSEQQTTATGTGSIEQFDAIVIGAGVSGLYQLYRLKQLGLSVRLYEDAAIQAAASIRRVKPTDTRSRRSYCTNGIGRSIFPANPRTNVTSIMSPTSSTCALTSSSIPASPRRSTTRRSIAGKSASTIANGRGHNFSSQRSASFRPITLPRLKGLRASRASRITPANGRRNRWTSPASASR